MCRHMCPVGHVTHLESLTPHGWGQVVASEKRGLIEWNESTVNVMYSCADCGVCESHCVTDQPLPDAIAAVRSQLVNDDLVPTSIKALQEQFTEWENLYEKKAPVSSKGTAEDVLFVGDAAVYLSPESLSSAVKLLEAVGVTPTLVGSGRNSGHLASSLGFTRLAKDLAAKNLQEIKDRGAKRVFVLSAGDYYTFTKLYADRLETAWPDDVEIIDLVVFLDEQLTSGKLAIQRIEMGLPFAYVDPTHTVRALDRVEAPRRLLEAVLPVPPLELFWRKERAHPCGDGALQFVNPSISSKLTKARIEDAQDIGAQGVVTEDPASLYQLSQIGAAGLPVKGMYELLADRLA